MGESWDNGDAGREKPRNGIWNINYQFKFCRSVLVHLHDSIIELSINNITSSHIHAHKHTSS